MRRVIYGAACSLDGFITAADGGIDWLHFSKDVQEYIAGFWQGIDTILMGRKTYEVALASAPGTKTRKTARKPPKSANPYGDMRSIVFSRTLNPADHPDLQIVADNAGEFVRTLKQQPGRNICVMGGGDLARSLLAADVVDEVGLNTHPVLLGSGTPLFLDAGTRIQLQLEQCRVIDGGCVLSTYAVRHRDRH